MGIPAILQTAPIEDMHGRLSLSPKGSIFVASDDLKTRQRDAMVASAMAATQRSATPDGDLTDSRGRQSGSRLSLATLQSQLARLSQVHSDNVVAGVLPKVAVGEQHLVFSLLEYECAFKAEYIQGV